MSTNLSFKVAGKAFLLLETAVKDHEERKYHTLRVPTAKASGFGIPFPQLSPSLPTQVEIDGLTVALQVGKSAAFKNVNGEKIAIPESDRRNSNTFSGHLTLPSLKGFDGPADEGIRSVKVTFSETKTPGVWNAKVMVNRIASVSPEDRAKSAMDKATANLAALTALMNAVDTTPATLTA